MAATYKHISKNILSIKSQKALKLVTSFKQLNTSQCKYFLVLTVWGFNIIHNNPEPLKIRNLIRETKKKNLSTFAVTNIFLCKKVKGNHQLTRWGQEGKKIIFGSHLLEVHLRNKKVFRVSVKKIKKIKARKKGKNEKSDEK